MHDTGTGCVRAFIGLGSNLGDRQGHLAEGLKRLAADPAVELVAVSGVYQTAPVGLTDQPAFLNCVAELRVCCTAREMLQRCLQVETEMGRVRRERWGPRNIDLDLLLFGDERIEEPDLVVPHPRIAERQFVLVPLAELAPDHVLPDGRTAVEAADPAADGIRKLDDE
jgi:2-amino-4-hydroxy-6-hydroxymethyldihydropteridine diphosphokinase